ncbi:MAG: hypothetical protein M3Q54_13410 [Actinomycetota bacterium]|nr:hypothetical protein [Actinomycetota bacterium]
MSLISCKSLAMVSRTEAVETAVGAFHPEIVGVIFSQNFLGEVARKCEELEPRLRILYRLVDSPMEIQDALSDSRTSSSNWKASATPSPTTPKKTSKRTRHAERFRA